MRSSAANEISRLSFWLRVRQFAVPPSMIEAATARRCVGDWAGACAAAHVDVDLNVRALARTHGQELAARVRADLRHLAPDLMRWHMPRIAPDGLLRPGVTVVLASYDQVGSAVGGVCLVARTAPGWADAGQRISLALWDRSRRVASTCPHPHPHPHRRLRLDLHRHLWDVRRVNELRIRSGIDGQPGNGRPVWCDDLLRTALEERGCAVDRWAGEAAILLHSQGQTSGTVAVRLGARHRLALNVVADGDSIGPPAVRITGDSGVRSVRALPVLPDAATWVLPDLELLRNGLIEVERLHPLVASALEADHPPGGAPGASDLSGQPRLMDCRGAQHRIGLVDGVLVPLDHDPAEIRREGLLAALTGTPLPCLREIDQAHRHPECLADIRARLDHGDTAGALAVVENLLGPDAVLRTGALRDELETAAQRRVTHGLFRAGLVGEPARTCPDRRRTRDNRARPRHATTR